MANANINNGGNKNTTHSTITIEQLKESYHKIDKEHATFSEKLESVRIEIKS